MILLHPEQPRWRIELPGFRPPLRPGLTFSVAREAVTFDSPAPAERKEALERWLNALAEAVRKWRRHGLPKPEDPTEILCRVVSWKYSISGEGTPGLEVTVEEVRAPRYLIADENTRAMTAMVFSVLILLTLLLLTIDFHYFPDDLWSVAGHVARWGGAIVLLAVVWWLVPSRLALGKKNRFIDLLYSSLIACLGWALLIGWLAIARYPPNFDGSHNAFVNYAHTLANKLRSDNWPLLLTALPWAAVAFKLLGFETAEKASEAMVKAAKD